METEPTLRERKKLRTRDALISASHRMFVKRGFENVTVDEIAVAADVSRRTFFRYFPSKEAVVFANVDERIAMFAELLGERHDGEGPFQAVRRSLMMLAQDYTEHRAEVVQVQRIVEKSPTLIAAEHAIDLEWEAVIADALLARTGTTEATARRARMIAGATIGVVRATLREWFAADGAGDLVAMGAENLDMLARGFPDPETGHPLFDAYAGGTEGSDDTDS